MGDISGEKFGRLTAIRDTGERRGRTAVWECRCECGTISKVKSTALRAGAIQSCGCMRRDSTVTHGQTNTPTYMTWKSMILRCTATTNGSYKHYGGRGIKVCDRWRNDFDAFRTDMGERPSRTHSIDRIDPMKGYEPGNCRWATVREQNRHRSDTKLSEEAAAEIRRLYQLGFYQREIARVFKVTDSLVSMICSGRIWRND